MNSVNVAFISKIAKELELSKQELELVIASIWILTNSTLTESEKTGEYMTNPVYSEMLMKKEEEDVLAQRNPIIFLASFAH
jgi:hypothetical protein